MAMRFLSRALVGAAALLLLVPPAAPVRAADEAGPQAAELRERLDAVQRENAALRAAVEELRSEVRAARDEARAAQELAAGSGPPVRAASPGAEVPLLSRPVGGASLQLLDVSLDVQAAAGGSTAPDREIEQLQLGDHDPRQRGFTLQQAELSFAGAVDPFLRGEVHLVYFLDPEGESVFELEEAFATSQRLPFGLERQGVQVEAGTFFTEFGRLNPVHPHAWDWLDQPVVLSRFFGPDGLRGPGVRVGWLTPLPWFSELHVGVQDAEGETMVSFLSSEEEAEEAPVGGRPFRRRDVSGLADFVYLLRWVNGVDLSDTWSGQLGVSGLFGPNYSGDAGDTRIYGGDLVLKWRPLVTDRGWPFLTFQVEALVRDYDADSSFFCPTGEEVASCSVPPLLLPSEELRDHGLYAQLLYGFRRNWAAGLRYEYASGRGRSAGAFDSRGDDPRRADRQRIAPLLVFHPSEFSRLRLQYNYDRADHLSPSDVHSLWAGLEFLFGSHPAHAY